MPSVRPQSERTSTVADAVEKHLRSLLENKVANVGKVTGWSEDLHGDLCSLRVCEDLSTRQQDDLVELFTKLLAIEHMHPGLKWREQRRRLWSQRGQGHIRKLTAKARAAQKAIADLDMYLRASALAWRMPSQTWLQFWTSRPSSKKVCSPSSKVSPPGGTSQQTMSSLCCTTGSSTRDLRKGKLITVSERLPMNTGIRTID